jgi:uncharacterized membrane protein
MMDRATNLSIVDGAAVVATASLATVSVQDWAAVACAAVTVFAMLPLALWRWRAFLRNEKKPEPPAPPCE